MHAYLYLYHQVRWRRWSDESWSKRIGFSRWHSRKIGCSKKLVARSYSDVDKMGNSPFEYMSLNFLPSSTFNLSTSSIHTLPTNPLREKVPQTNSFWVRNGDVRGVDMKISSQSFLYHHDSLVGGVLIQVLLCLIERYSACFKYPPVNHACMSEGVLQLYKKKLNSRRILSFIHIYVKIVQRTRKGGLGLNVWL